MSRGGLVNEADSANNDGGVNGAGRVCLGTRKDDRGEVDVSGARGHYRLGISPTDPKLNKRLLHRLHFMCHEIGRS